MNMYKYFFSWTTIEFKPLFLESDPIKQLGQIV